MASEDRPLAMRCLQCGKRLPLFRKIDGDFCSPAHAADYAQREHSSALMRLRVASQQDQRSRPAGDRHKPARIAAPAPIGGALPMPKPRAVAHWAFQNLTAVPRRNVPSPVIPLRERSGSSTRFASPDRPFPLVSSPLDGGSSNRAPQQPHPESLHVGPRVTREVLLEPRQNPEPVPRPDGGFEPPGPLLRPMPLPAPPPRTAPRRNRRPYAHSAPLRSGRRPGALARLKAALLEYHPCDPVCDPAGILPFPPAAPIDIESRARRHFEGPLEARPGPAPARRTGFRQWQASFRLEAAGLAALDVALRLRPEAPRRAEASPEAVQAVVVQAPPRIETVPHIPTLGVGVCFRLGGPAPRYHDAGTPYPPPPPGPEGLDAGHPRIRFQPPVSHCEVPPPGRAAVPGPRLSSAKAAPEPAPVPADPIDPALPKLVLRVEAPPLPRPVKVSPFSQNRLRPGFEQDSAKPRAAFPISTRSPKRSVPATRVRPPASPLDSDADPPLAPLLSLETIFPQPADHRARRQIDSVPEWRRMRHGLGFRYTPGIDTPDWERAGEPGGLKRTVAFAEKIHGSPFGSSDPNRASRGLWNSFSRYWKSVPVAARWAVPVVALAVSYYVARGQRPVAPNPAAPGETVEFASAAAAAPSEPPAPASGQKNETAASWQSVKGRIKARAAVVLVDDFRAGLGDWTGEGNWARGWAYDLAGFVRPRAPAIYAPTLDMSDYRMELLGQIDQRALGWMLRAADSRNYYAVRLLVAEPGPVPKVVLERYPVTRGVPGPVQRKPLHFPVRNDTSYRVLTLVRGNEFSVSVQGNVVDSWTEPRFRRGGVGLFSAGTDQARVRWISVTHQDDLLGKLCAFFAPPGSGIDRGAN